MTSILLNSRPSTYSQICVKHCGKTYNIPIVGLSYTQIDDLQDTLQVITDTLLQMEADSCDK